MPFAEVDAEIRHECTGIRYQGRILVNVQVGERPPRCRSKLGTCPAASPKGQLTASLSGTELPSSEPDVEQSGSHGKHDRPPQQPA